MKNVHNKSKHGTNIMWNSMKEWNRFIHQNFPIFLVAKNFSSLSSESIFLKEILFPCNETWIFKKYDLFNLLYPNLTNVTTYSPYFSPRSGITLCINLIKCVKNFSSWRHKNINRGRSGSSSRRKALSNLERLCCPFYSRARARLSRNVCAVRSAGPTTTRLDQRRSVWTLSN